MPKVKISFFKTNSIRFQLVMVYSLVVLVTLVVVNLAIHRSVAINLDNEVNDNLQERAWVAQKYLASNLYITQQDMAGFGQVFGNTPQITPSSGNRPVYTRPTPSMVKPEFNPVNLDLATSLTYLQVTLLNGQILRAPEVEIMAQSEAQAELHNLTTNLTTPIFSNLQLKGGEMIRVYSIPLMVRGQLLGYVQSVRSLGEVDAILNSLAVPLFISALLAIGLLALGGGLATRRAFRPIEKITEAAYRIGVNDNLTERIETNPESNDEVSRLGRAFNSMLDRVEKNFIAQKQFIADSSHELRTPLTVIRGNLDLLKRNPDPKNQETSLKAVEREVDRMQRLVQDLLLLAQADATQTLDLSPIQLDTLVLEVFMEAHVLSDARRQNLKLGHFDPLTVEGDSERLKRAILNLVDNSIKYTPEGGTVTISLFKGRKWARVIVADTGIGIAPKDQPLIFDRFFRVDKARTRTTSSTGLGLAIVKHIVEAHGGRITLESEPGVGSTFTLWLLHSSTGEPQFEDEEDLDTPIFEVNRQDLAPADH